MPSFIKPKLTASGTSIRPVTPMSERQQLALLMQMTSPDLGSRSPSNSRSRDRNERGETPLHIAAIKGDVEQVCRLLAHRSDPNVADFAGWTPLHEACNHGWYEVACRLVQAGANVNAKGLDNETPLHDAATNGHVKLVKLLVDRGADVFAKNSKGKTPLDVATAAVMPILLENNSSHVESGVSRLQPRARDDKKITEPKQKSDESMEAKTEDVYEFKPNKDADMSEQKPDGTDNDKASDSATPASVQDENKRNYSELCDGSEEIEDENKRKKRKDDGKENKSVSQQRNFLQNKTTGKNGGVSKNGNTKDRKSPIDSPKPSSTSDAELDESKTDLKVPPLKIVIPQSSTNEQESGQNRNGKNNSQRSHPLPYVVPSSNEGEKDASVNSPVDGTPKNEDKKDSSVAAVPEDQRSNAHHQRVLRSSHRSGTQADRSSNNSSPQLQRSHSPSPSTSPAATQIDASTVAAAAAPEDNTCNNSDTETPAPNVSNAAMVSSAPPVVELHPRKRKMKPNKEQTTTPNPSHEQQETSSVSELHPHEQPITNCYQLFLNIRKQIDKRRKGLFPVQPKPPQGFKDYLMNRCTYVLASTAPTIPNINYPASLPSPMKDIFGEQEKERYKLRMQHVIEKEKLVLSVEQEILRVHGRAARALANQSLPFSVCTILRDEEVYNLITPEQEEKDRNARSRYNGRLFLSWLQDVDDKWEKIKEHMLLRHHNEAESLYAVQKMNWEWKLKELSLCDAKIVPTIDDLHVPMVHVSDDFDLLPA